MKTKEEALNQILTDFSHHQKRVLPTAGAGGISTDTTITLIHVSEDALWGTDVEGTLLRLGLGQMNLWDKFLEEHTGISPRYQDQSLREAFRATEIAEWLKEEGLFQSRELWKETPEGREYFKSEKFARDVRQVRGKDRPTAAHVVKEVYHECRRQYDTSNIDFHSCIHIPEWHSLAVRWAGFRKRTDGRSEVRPTRSVTHYLTFDWGTGRSLSSWGIYADGSYCIFAD
jgi:hypothetical protein